MHDFPSVLAFFLSDGASVLSYHIPLMLRQLYRLASIVYSLDRFRFYAASLLFIYDGDAVVQDRYEQSVREEVEKVGGLGEETEANDPDHSTSFADQKHAADGSWTVPSPPLLPTTATTPKSSDSISPLPPHHPSRPASLRAPKKRSKHLSAPPSSHHHSSSPSAASSKKAKVPGAVIIRLVDFANCTTGDDYIDASDPSIDLSLEENANKIHATFPPTHPNQPDLGFLLGLKSLCAALKMIWIEEQEKLLAEASSAAGGEGLVKGGEELELSIEGEMIFEKIFGVGALQQGLGEGPGPEDVWNLSDLVTA